MTATAQRHRSTMRGDIEGLRSIAVLFVLVYHLGFAPLSGGFAGVDVFFVISGFLITSGLIKDTERRGRVSLTEFYARRARRLLPAATLVLLFVTLVGPQVMPRAELSTLATDVGAAALYVVNWALAFRAVDYLAEDASVSPVQHYWSLSVEEQFYVVIPILMIVIALLARRFGLSFRRVLTGALGLIVVASFVYSVAHTASSPQTAYFFSTTRAWELGIGALLACAVPLLRRMPHPVAVGLGVTGLAAILVSGFVISSSTPWPGSAAALPTLGTAAVIGAGVATTATPVARLLGVAPMVWIGGLSYSIYLWHWPLIVFAGELGSLRWWHKLGILVASVGAAWLSKKLVEDPIRFGGPWSRRTRPALAMGAVGMAISLVAATVVWAQAPRLGDKPASLAGGGVLFDASALQRASAMPEPDADPERYVTRAGEVYPDPALAPTLVPAYYDDECQVAEGDPEIDPRCVYGKKDGDVTVALWGDSKLGQWFDVFNDIALQHGWRLELYLKSGCPANPEEEEADCREFGENVLDRLTDPAHRVDAVLVSGGRSTNDKNDPAANQAYVDGYDAYWSKLEAVGTRVLAVSDSPQTGSLKHPRYECADEHPDDLLACAFKNNPGTGTSALRAAVEESPDRVFLDLNPWICPEMPDGRCPIVIGGYLVYRQGSHITTTYAMTLEPVVERMLEKAGLFESSGGQRLRPAQ